MKTVVFHGIGDIRLEDVPEPTLRAPGWMKVKLDPQATDGARTPHASHASHAPRAPRA
jgi:threonine dehydrogenase-like Zn-dependent dehydrogenase